MRIVGVKILRIHVESFEALNVSDPSMNIKSREDSNDDELWKLRYESHLECHRLKQHHRNLIIKSKCDHLSMQISTFDVLIKTLFTYVNFIDGSRKNFATMVLEARKFHQVMRHQRRIHATLNSALMSDDSANKSQNIQWHHHQSTELINSFLR